MSKRTLSLVMLLAAVLALSAGTCAAQVQPRQYGTNTFINRPPVSPYMNLLRVDGSITGNYYTLVRPQIEAANALNRQQHELQRLESRVTGMSNNQSAPADFRTGHQTTFGNYSHYYNLGATSAGRRR